MMKAASIFLRAEITMDDVRRMIRWMENPHITRFLNEDPQIVYFLQNLAENVPEPMLGYHFNRLGRFFLVCDGTSQSIGFVKLVPQPNGAYEIVYVIGEETLWGHGMGKAALRMALEKVFLEWRGTRVVAKIAPQNTRSIRSASACGFRQLGLDGKHMHFEMSDRAYFQQLSASRQKRA